LRLPRAPDPAGPAYSYRNRLATRRRSRRDAAEQDEAADEEHADGGDRRVLVAAECERHAAEYERAEHRARLPDQRVEAEELRLAVRRHQRGHQRAARRLDGAEARAREDAD